MLDSDEELTPSLSLLDCSDCRSASSLAYFFTYSDTFFLYSSGLVQKNEGIQGDSSGWGLKDVDYFSAFCGGLTKLDS